MFIFVLIVLLCVGVLLQTYRLQHTALKVAHRVAVAATPAGQLAHQPRVYKAALHIGFVQYKRRVPHAPFSASCCWSSGFAMAMRLL